MTRHGFMTAAPQSGSGKTTVSLAIMAALTRRGLTVRPFKCGPDFIDPGYHRLVTGTPSSNLDAWMCGEEFVLKSFQTSQISPTGLTITVIEGAMGLFDGFGSSIMEGSSAQVAAIAGVPVVLVVNARGMAASAAALVSGFAGFHPQVHVAGVIFNNVGSDQHAALLRKVVEQHCPGLRCFGCIPRDEVLAIPSRHLGLVTADESPLPEQFIQLLADVAENCLDLDALMQLKTAGAGNETQSPSAPFSSRPRIAVARDAVFCFCYDDNLRLLEKSGAELVYFSPLADTRFPDGISGLYLPGGYPELYAEQLAGNITLLNSIKAVIEHGMPVYAECGGFMYLTEGMESGENFVGVFPVRTRMLPKRKALGYREILLIQDTLIGAEGEICRGHEFHYSEITAMPESVERLYRVSRRGECIGYEGYRIKNCLGSYIHLHFGSNPEIAPSFVASCYSYASI